MHFKSAVIFCALFFVTAIHGYGTTFGQLHDMVLMFQSHETSSNKLPEKDITAYASKFGLDISGFDYNLGNTGAQKAQGLVLYMADINKTSDSFSTIPNLSSHEVKLIVKLFVATDKSKTEDGLLTYNEVMDLIAAFNLEKSRKTKLAALFSIHDNTINVAEFLETYLATKPQGNGLHEDNVRYLLNLHNHHKQVNDKISSDEIFLFFQNLSLVTKGNENHLRFTSNRPCIVESQELLVVLAEYNRLDYTDDNTYVMPTVVARYILADFNVNDKNNNALLSQEEFEQHVKYEFPKENATYLMNTSDVDGDGHLSIMEFFLMFFNIKKNLLNGIKK